MKTKINITILFFISLLYSSCNYKTIDNVKFDSSNKMALYCFFNPDSVWTAQVYKMGNVMDKENTDLYVRNAQVELYEQDSLINILEHIENGFYKSSTGLKPKYGEKYHIRVSSPGLETLTSSIQQLPDSIKIESVEYHNELIKDIFPEEDYVIIESSGWNYATIDIILSQIYPKKHLSFYSINNENSKSSLMLSLSSKNKFIEYWGYDSNIIETTSNENLYIQVGINIDYCNSINFAAISNDYFFYELSFVEYDFIINTTYLLTPNNVYSNIKNGIGIFAGYTVTQIKLVDYIN